MSSTLVRWEQNRFNGAVGRNAFHSAEQTNELEENLVLIYSLLQTGDEPFQLFRKRSGKT